MTEKYGRLTLLERSTDYISPKGAKLTRWLCQCDCGNKLIVLLNSLRTGNTQSCGCFKPRKIHGKSKTVEYQAWFNINERVNNSDRHNYVNYENVSICDRWLEPDGQGFLNFLEDMGERPSKNHSIDRIDPNGNYEPSNCRWATVKTQSFNKKVRDCNTSGVTGVTLTKSGRWNAKITYNGKQISKRFKNKEEAIMWRKSKEKEFNILGDANE